MKRAALLLLASCHSNTPGPAPATGPRTIALATHGIGFDDLVFATNAGKILAPAGATCTLAIIDPTTFAVESRAAFTAPASVPYTTGRHDDGVTSATETPDHILVTDRTHLTLDSFKGATLDAHAALAASPDYVRFVRGANEIWVTEPDASQIELFSSSLAPIGKIAVPGGPESLVVSESRKAAYSNLWHKQSVEIDVATHTITRTFDSGCEKTRGIALDDSSGALFVACNDGRTVKLDLASGKVTAEGRAGDGVDIIDWSKATGHLYVPAARAGTLTIFDAALHVVKTLPAPRGAHCVAADQHGQAWVCDPDHGSLVVYAENP